MRVPILEDDPKVTLRRKQIVIGLCPAALATGQNHVAAIDATRDRPLGLQTATDYARELPLGDQLGSEPQARAHAR